MAHTYLYKHDLHVKITLVNNLMQAKYVQSIIMFAAKLVNMFMLPLSYLLIFKKHFL